MKYTTITVTNPSIGKPAHGAAANIIIDGKGYEIDNISHNSINIVPQLSNSSTAPYTYTYSYKYEVKLAEDPPKIPTRKINIKGKYKL